MKKIFLYRLTLITCFCFISLLIKSEGTVCPNNCSTSALIVEDTSPDVFVHDAGPIPHDAPFIKI